MKYFAYKFRAHRPLPKGTRVVVRRKIEEDALLEGYDIWVYGMDTTLGCRGVITGDQATGYRINTPHVLLDRGESWWYPNASLEVLRD